MPPKLRLPPLPPADYWGAYFPRGSLSKAVDFQSKEFPGRVLLANPTHADEFVRELKLKPNEVVIEAWGGPGALTRSLVTGGASQELGPERERWLADYRQKCGIQEDLGESVESNAPKKRVRPKKVTTELRPLTKRRLKDYYPSWAEEWDKGMDVSSSDTSSKSPDHDETHTKPKYVVALESASDLLVAGLGLDPADGRSEVTYAEIERSHDALEFRALASAPSKPDRSENKKTRFQLRPTAIFPSVYEDNLGLAPASPYAWGTVPALLETPVLSQMLEDPPQGGALPGSENPAHRLWSSDPPNVTYVAHIPDHLNGEGLVAQWINSSIGAAEGSPHWIWRWGRVRMAILCGRGLYDRMTARAGENIRCKLSVFTEALYDLKPLAPHHHVPNVDRSSRYIEARPGSATQNSPVAMSMLDSYVGLNLPRTTTRTQDFWPIRTLRPDLTKPLPRPLLLGLEMVPKKVSYIKEGQREAWEFVMRHCFVRQATPISDGVKTLGFGAANLMKDIADPNSGYAGDAVDPSILVRDMSVAQWARIVDVFDNWAFKPQHLTTELMSEAEFTIF